MEPRKYHNIRLSRAGNETWKFIKEQKIYEIIIISIGTLINGGSVVYKYNDILMALSYEFEGLLIMLVLLFFWKSLRVVPERIYNEQQDTIDSLRKTIESLEGQQLTRLEVTFEKGVRPWVLDRPATANNQEFIFRIELMNLGSDMIKNARVRLLNIDPLPDDSFDVPCDLLIDDKNIRKTDNQGEGEFVSVFKYLFHNRSKDGTDHLWMIGSENNKGINMPLQEYEIKIIVSSENSGDPITKHFRFDPIKRNPKVMMEMID